MQSYDVAVIGRGLTGSAAARHARALGASVVLIGPDEPVDRSLRGLVHGSHYDAGRITRVIDPLVGRARLSLRSLLRHRALEQETGIRFFHEVGHLAVGSAATRDAGYLHDLAVSAQALDVDITTLDDAALAQRYPEFHFERGCLGLHQATLAGFIDPRAMVQAQCVAAERAGVVVCRERVVAVAPRTSDRVVTTAAGRSWCAARVIVAAGTFVDSIRVPGAPLRIGVEALSVVLARLDESEAARLAHLPSLIYKPADPALNLYLLPPARYPDGRSYLKLGSPWPHAILEDLAALEAWHREPLPQAVRAALRARLEEFMPDLRVEHYSYDTCSAQHTPGGYARLGYGDDPGLVWCLGCGAGAKSADEIGRLAAVLALEGRWDSDLPADWFIPRQGASFDYPPIPAAPYGAAAA